MKSWKLLFQMLLLPAIVFSATAFSASPHQDDKSSVAEYAKIKFPNSHGKEKPNGEEVKRLQEKYHFSDSYANFLLTQNGLDLDNHLPDSSLEKITVDEAYFHPNFDLRYLYDVNAGSKFTDLATINEKENPFLPYFFFIGRGYDGSAYAEICIGEKKGAIVFLNEEMFMGMDNVQTWLKEIEISEEEIGKLTPQQIESLLLSPEFDLATIVADSFDSFLRDSLGYNYRNHRGAIHLQQ